MRLTIGKALFISIVLTNLAFGQDTGNNKDETGPRLVKDRNGWYVLLMPNKTQVITGPYSLIMSDPAAVFAVNGKSGGIGIGTANPDAQLEIVSPGIVNGTVRDMIELHSNYGIGASIFTHSDVGYRAPQITFFRSGGTRAAPTPVTAGEVLSTIVGAGYDGKMEHDIPGYAQPAILDVVASENFDSTHNGAYFDFQLIAVGGSTVLQHALLFDTNRARFYEPLTVPQIIVSSPRIPTSSSDIGTQGQIEWDSNFIYVCIATNTWKRMAISAW